jgi:hypothetical protein
MCIVPHMENIMLDNPGNMASKKASSKREKFVELAESRTKNAIKAIRVIAKLGNKNAYQYDDSDVQKIAPCIILPIASGLRPSTSTAIIMRLRRYLKPSSCTMKLLSKDSCRCPFTKNTTQRLPLLCSR